jgi:hypothetical protein
MKKNVLLFVILKASIVTGWCQQYGVDKAPSVPTSASSGLVFSWSAWASQNFLYDGEYLNHYGMGFHDFNDGNNIGGINAYIASHFGVDIFTGGQNRFRINHNGNVGIGGTPQIKLDVGNFRNGGLTNQVVFRLRNTIAQNSSSGWGSAIEFFNMSNNIESIALNEGGAKIISEASEYGWAHNLKFRVVKNNNYSNQTGIDALVINTAGNVGIGTTDPGSFKLAVNGKIWTQEVNVTMTNPGPDYVFEKEYDLLSLSELETYINQNKHLPEVPSAKEMEAEGLNLKEMNLLLLKKVEELTLHLIEMKKQLDGHEEKIRKCNHK